MDIHGTGGLTLVAFAASPAPTLLCLIADLIPDSANECSSEIPSLPYLGHSILVHPPPGHLVVAAVVVVVAGGAVATLVVEMLEGSLGSGQNSYSNSEERPCSSRPVVETEPCSSSVVAVAGAVEVAYSVVADSGSSVRPSSHYCCR